MTKGRQQSNNQRKPLQQIVEQVKDLNAVSEDEGIFLVDKILDKKKQGKKTFYLVKWEGFPESEATWEPPINLRNVKDIIQMFEKSIMK